MNNGVETGYLPVEQRLFRKNEVLVFEGFADDATIVINQELERLKDLHPVVKSTSVNHGDGQRIVIAVTIEHD
ncbi:MAG: hypothetical protein H6772_02005 [Pseudomonadales bacterium]|nr:hypothetical protein [Pseudomonadales bacterium]